MGEFLRKIREAQGAPLQKPRAFEPDPRILALPRDVAQTRLDELRAMIKGFGSSTVEDRRLMDSLEARLRISDSSSPVQTGVGSEGVHSPAQTPVGPIRRRMAALAEQRATS